MLLPTGTGALWLSSPAKTAAVLVHKRSQILKASVSWQQKMCLWLQKQSVKASLAQLLGQGELLVVQTQALP
jgi:hypothetical protein